MNFKAALIMILLLPFTITVSGQYYDTGQDPASLKWLQIKTERFRVIYPRQYGDQGVEFAKSLDRAYSDLNLLFPQKKYRIPVIIHNYTTQSNGYVAWAPRRMEIYPTPEQNSIPLDPFRQLALHELTHVYQMESLNSGFSKAISYIAGQQFPGAMAALLPLWYMEGEAVMAESVLSESGRGRAASFQKELRAISVEKGQMYKYDRIVNGSFRNYVPDHYQSGYQIVSWIYSKYDPRTWNKALKLTANAPYLINPVGLSLRHNTGLNKRKLFIEAFDTLGSVWKAENERKEIRDYEELNPPRGKKFASYHSPVKTGDNRYAAIKTTLYNPPEFVIIDSKTKTEEKVHVPGYMYPYRISAGNMQLAWVELQTDPRWDNRNYSVIRLMNLRDRTVKQISWKTRYMSAAISPDGRVIAATENTPDNRNNLVLINSLTGKIIKSLPVPDNRYLQKPYWSADGNTITFISLNSKGEGIVSFNNSSQKWSISFPESPEDYQSAVYRNDSLFYVSSHCGTENLYVLTPGKENLKITNSGFGATDILLEGGKVIFSDYSYSGNNICHTNIREGKPVSHEYDPAFFLSDVVRLPRKTVSDEPEIKYTPERYRKGLNLFGFHSWMPVYADLDQVRADPLTAVKPGLTLFSQNQLSTLITSVGYEYTDRLHKIHSRVTWQGWYPVFETRLDWGDNPLISKPNASTGDPSVIKPGLSLTGSLYVPLKFRSGKFNLFIRPSLLVSYENNYIYSTESAGYDYGQTQIAGRFYFSNSYPMAMRDIHPRLAQVVDLFYSSFPFDNENFGSSFTLRTMFYFPGIMRNNVIRIRYENEFQTVIKFLNFNLINFPRGYTNIISEDLTYFSADYIAPLFYPDLNIGSLIYVKRFRGGVFYDYGKGTNNYYLEMGDNGLEVTSVREFSETFSSYGAELLSDFHVLRLPYMVSAGARASWIKGETKPLVEAIISIDIYGMSIGRKPHL
ncbi:MAG TPA: hypothetical protein PLV06_12440 [Bacteroidales bacterium]|nr:hypothetical protein [Bacteroidales bacterium]HPJ59308.1 hypothetical protein [Bacteroidales bacterium]HPR13188.1 hypothetical protein [Bacteroidales bacterium]HRW83929.1 hypothetical protein [Bacteroidales bacterium]